MAYLELKTKEIDLIVEVLQAEVEQLEHCDGEVKDSQKRLEKIIAKIEKQDPRTGGFYKNRVGDKCRADSCRVYITNGRPNIVAEVDGGYFESLDYKNHKVWLSAIVKRVYKCAMGKLN